MIERNDKTITTKKKTWRVLHFSAQRVLTSGQRQQLIFERSAAERVSRAQWEILAYHNAEPVEDFERTIHSCEAWLFGLLVEPLRTGHTRGDGRNLRSPSR